MPLGPFARVDGREDEVAVRLRRVRDPDLRPVEAIGRDIVGGSAAGTSDPVASRRTARVRSAAASDAAMGLREAERTERLAGEHRGQPVRMLLRRAERHHRVLAQDVDRQGDGRRHLRGGDLLHHERPAEVAESGPADALGERRAGQPEGAHPLEDGTLEALRFVALDRARGDLSRWANSRAVSRSSRSSLVSPPLPGTSVDAHARQARG